MPGTPKSKENTFMITKDNLCTAVLSIIHLRKTCFVCLFVCFFLTKVSFIQGAFKNYYQGLLWKIQGLFKNIQQFLSFQGLSRPMRTMAKKSRL